MPTLTGSLPTVDATAVRIEASAADAVPGGGVNQISVRPARRVSPEGCPPRRSRRVGPRLAPMRPAGEQRGARRPCGRCARVLSWSAARGPTGVVVVALVMGARTATLSAALAGCARSRRAHTSSVPAEVPLLMAIGIPFHDPHQVLSLDPWTRPSVDLLSGSPSC